MFLPHGDVITDQLTVRGSVERNVIDEGRVRIRVRESCSSPVYVWDVSGTAD